MTTSIHARHCCPPSSHRQWHSPHTTHLRRHSPHMRKPTHLRHHLRIGRPGKPSHMRHHGMLHHILRHSPHAAGGSHARRPGSRHSHRAHAHAAHHHSIHAHASHAHAGVPSHHAGLGGCGGAGASHAADAARCGAESSQPSVRIGIAGFACGRFDDRPIGTIIVQPAPNLGKECLSRAKLHLDPLVIVCRPRHLQLLQHRLGNLATPCHMIMQHIQRLGRIAQRLNARGEESSRAVSSKAMSASQSRKTGGESLAFSQAIGLGEDARLHLTEEEVRECRGGGFVSEYDEGGCLGGWLLLFIFLLFTVAIVLVSIFFILLFSIFLIITFTLPFLLLSIFLIGITRAPSPSLLRHPLAHARTRRRRRLLGAQFNPLQGIHEPQTFGTLDPVLFAGAGAGIVLLELGVFAHDVGWDFWAGVEVSLEEVHGGVVYAR
mmetsp:Transcript_26672/g.48068  ORF Transcript_26672/g.48068 Transcript_26672/m.48068 type:complete len:434 (-) Transcript_26672:581-1882(-)